MPAERFLVASRRLIDQNAHLLAEAQRVRSELLHSTYKPWKWRQRRALRAELDQLIARIEDNADRIDALQDAAEKQLESL